MSLYKAGHDFGISERKESPKVIPLPMGRLRVVRRFDLANKDAISHKEFNSEKPEDLTIKVFGGFGLLDGTNLQELPDLPDGSEWSKASKEFAYKDCHLVEEDADPGQDNKWILTQTYETLTDAWANEDVDKASTSDTGLAQLTRTQVAKRGTALPYTDEQVGVLMEGGLALGAIEDLSTDMIGRVATRWSAPGVISVGDSYKYNNKVTIYSVTVIGLTAAQAKASISGLPADALSFGSKINNYEGLQTLSYEFFTGNGEISTSVSWSMNGKLKRTTIVSIGEAPATPAGASLIDAKVETRDGFILYTYTFVEGEGEISQSIDTRYNGKLTITTVTSLNTPAIGTGSLVSTKTDARDGYILYTSQYAEGAGVISSSEDTRFNGKLTVKTVTSINEVPQGNGAVIESKVDARDGFILYTYQFADGSGEISSSTDTRFDGKLTVKTVTSINEVPTGDGAVINTKIDARDGFILYTYQFAEGSGEIARSEEERYNGALTITTITSIEEKPDSGGVIIDTQQRAQDGYMLYTYKFADGQGEMSKSTDSRTDGSEVVTITSINEEPNPPGGDFYRVKESTQERDGFVLYTYSWYKMPEDYDVPVSMLVRMPAEIIHDNDMGPKIASANPGREVPVTGTAEVSFTDIPPEAVNLKSMSPTVVVDEFYKTDEGERISKQHIFNNAASDAGYIQKLNGNYRGEEIRIGGIGYVGPSFSSYVGQVITGWAVTPYFSAGGVRIYKVTKTTVTLAISPTTTLS